MSGAGAPTFTPDPAAARGLNVAIVAAQWHTEIMDGLIAGAQAAAADLGLEPVLVRVPGTVELTVAAARLAERFDAVVVLGVVVRGDTPHFDYVCQSVTQGVTEVSVRTGVPVGFGVLTVDTEQQARDRAGLPGSREDKGREALEAAVLTELALRSVTPRD
ncbi:MULTISPECIES: 6,7-dimethyl-8-ribityllumazine synthase [Micrococcus]|uniref:6,7-dimethyl-8-ribityllumazine synthase n=1 Tax=Micrococcus luteus TaxID=1270 RepID=UPI0019D22235|nr:6,7-dimethyl-8-ribityllumazine synthase [Micrococcus luteus]MBN6768267.1 6,7-dimethyl-8-ribityllumazine synthase [Micrococcus luteus]MBN6827903.1 6,7-dimethyl-8-ribityllumazine synthase [Micrococcus luteus]MBN6844893.1 6,7-dimethyl-8-ribityllumazine synthase [Micrococcus luteus]MBN6861819.1 6,7-dimethyl-8-ribityllumazine synthase [Micrococcus luteus]MBN6864726.1 6,7-dimethyl-8-ribityllumazine synthase [Micrococcus luteus]